MANRYEGYILRKLREAQDIEMEDDSKDNEIQSMLPYEAFKSILEWEGIIGYSYKIVGYINDLYNIDLERY